MNPNKQKRCLTLQDYSCMGRCSLSEALPTLSACGIEAVGIPTAILSNHTAGFKSWTYRDLKEDILPIIDKWKDYEHHFDAIYTGYLGDSQVPIILKAIDSLRTKDTLIAVDPAFADNKKLYPGFKETHIEEMRKLLKKADIIFPNLTEACFLANEEMGKIDQYDEDFVKSVEMKLANEAPSFVIISGIHFSPKEVGCLAYDKKRGAFFKYSTENIGEFHGAGDLFASSFVGSFLNGFSLEESLRISHNFVHEAMRITLENKDLPSFYGLEFERAIPYLIKSLSKK